MLWPDVQCEILDACRPLLESRGFKFVKSRSSFERSTATGRLMFQFRFSTTHQLNHWVQAGCGVRHDAIERIVHQSSAIDKAAKSSTTTINKAWTRPLIVNTAEEQAAAITQLQTYVQEVALPFLEREYTLKDISALLNVTDPEGLPIWGVAFGIHHWQRGLAAAKLAGDPRFENLRRHYTAHVRAWNNGLYFPAFEGCLKFIDEHVGQPRARSQPLWKIC